jgi:hypothetical protein
MLLDSENYRLSGVNVYDFNDAPTATFAVNRFVHFAIDRLHCQTSTSLITISIINAYDTSVKP